MSIELPQSELTPQLHVPQAIRDLSPDLFNYLESLKTYIGQTQQGLFANDLAINDSLSEVEYLPLSYLDTDTALTANADDRVSSQKATKAYADAVLQRAYPVGSVYINAANSTNPSTTLGFGTWVAVGAGRALVTVNTSDSDFDTVGKTGGAKTHTLTAAETPAHTHGSAGAHTHKVASSSSGSIDGVPKASDQVASAAVDSSSSGSHTHDSIGGGGAHANLQPYEVIGWVWRRTI